MTDAPAEIDIRIAAGRWREAAAGDVEEAVRRAALAALEDLPGPLEVSVLLTDDAEIAALNARWRDRDGPTNVLSFPGDGAAPAPGAPVPLGDIALACETVAREARRDAVPFADHLAHLVVHGVLHLRGFDHATEAEAETMEARETAILAGIGVADPYADRAGRPGGGARELEREKG